ncbi:ATP-binding protein [Thermopolyspora sp. NPDC052614]|uniref:ATP-binding protein n=1 Tax=Thermopolyspora sp. NPDC052614 TaxID=3155682 RepID=UPI00342CFEF2
MEFVGRSEDLRVLEEQLRVVVEGRGGTRGRALIITGRRRVGKSRLVQEFCDRSGLPYVVFQATKGRSPAAERRDLAQAIACSALPGRQLVEGLEPADWNHALRSVAVAASEQSPCVVVLDEVPWLVEQDREFEGALQTAWDRHLSSRPILLILVGSDLSVMESLQEYGRPFFGRAARMTVRPLHLGDVAEMTGLSATDAVDALLITGGFPEVVRSWTPGMTRADFLRASLANPLSPLLASGELSMLGEFPAATLARAVLEAIGTGERTFAAIAKRAGVTGPLPSGTLAPIVNNLIAKRVVSVDLPLSTQPDTRNKRYRVADPYLRFWLAFLQRAVAESERGRPDMALRRIERSWTAWRGRAVEPIIRESLARLLPDDAWPETEAIGGWWNRRNNPEIDLVGADREPVAGQIHFVGSIKWLDSQPFDRHDYDALARDATFVPGTTPTTPKVAVSRAGVEPALPLDAIWTPEDLLAAWTSPPAAPRH